MTRAEQLFLVDRTLRWAGPDGVAVEATARQDGTVLLRLQRGRRGVDAHVPVALSIFALHRILDEMAARLAALLAEHGDGLGPDDDDDDDDVGDDKDDGDGDDDGDDDGGPQGTDGNPTSFELPDDLDFRRA